MKLSSGLVFAGLVALGLSTYSCANGDTVSGNTGNGGSSGEGGSTGNGGTTGNGGSTGTGGSKGGSTGTGGSKGGSTGTGGTVSTGGTTGSGGSKGGTTGTGGNNSTGGTTGNGGTTGSGGSTGTGGQGTTMCGTSFDTNATGFVTMPVKGGGCWSGYAYTYADKYGTTISPMSPTPGFSTCGMPCALTATGSIVAVAGTNYSYAGVAFGLGQTVSGGSTNTPVNPTGTSITITYTATGPTGLPIRVQLVDAAMNDYCYTVTSSPATIPYTSFNTKCYDTPADGTAYATNIGINAIQLQVAGGTGSGPYSLTITSVVEN